MSIHIFMVLTLISSSSNAWEAALEDELNNVKKYDEWMPRKLQDLPPDAKIITSTWSTKNNAKDTYQASPNSRGHVQVEGIHYDT